MIFARSLQLLLPLLNARRETRPPGVVSNSRRSTHHFFFIFCGLVLSCIYLSGRGVVGLLQTSSPPSTSGQWRRRIRLSGVCSAEDLSARPRSSGGKRLLHPYFRCQSYFPPATWFGCEAPFLSGRCEETNLGFGLLPDSQSFNRHSPSVPFTG